MKPALKNAFALLALLSGTAATAAEATANGSGLSGESLSAGYLLQLILGLVVVLFAIVVLVWLMRRFGRFQSGASGALRVLGGLSMGPRERVVLIQVGETQLLLGVAPGRVQTLHVLEQPVETSVQPAAAESFALRFGAALRGKKEA